VQPFTNQQYDGVNVFLQARCHLRILQLTALFYFLLRHCTLDSLFFEAAPTVTFSFPLESG